MDPLGGRRKRLWHTRYGARAAVALYKSDLLHILCSSVMHTSVRSRVVVDTPRSCRCSFKAWWEVTLYIQYA